MRTSSFTNAKVKKVLKAQFGLSELRDGQSEVIHSVLRGEPTLAIMPTGAGKSLCFQLPALMLPGTAIVVSPLIALMKDQKEKLDRLHIPNVEVNSTLTAQQTHENADTVAEGSTEFIYVTPERLANAEFLKSIDHLNIDLMVIDEAHCLSQWGHDFRPAYLGLGDVWRKLGQPRILALTATATGKVIEDIKEQLDLPNLNVFSSGVLRDNLVYEGIVFDTEAEKTPRLLTLLRETEGSRIVYCASVRSAKALHDELQSQGLETDLYHGKMSAKERTASRQSFMNSNRRIMIATNAFGMGIDKPDIRLIVHFQFPGSLEAYVQESGRAGRDGEMARCILFYLKKDKSTQSFFLAGKYPTLENFKMLIATIDRLEQSGQSVTALAIKEKSELSKTKIKVMLTALKGANLLSLDDEHVTLARTSIANAELESAANDYILKKQADAEKLKQMIIYAQTSMCRWKLILKYFEQETDWETCGHCDNCLAHKSELRLA